MGLQTYQQLTYSNLWSGINLSYKGTTDRLKYAVTIEPGKDPKLIRLAYRGATEVKINRKGQLEVSTPIKTFTDEKPIAWQEYGGKRHEVSVAYTLEKAPNENIWTYGFRVGKYDHSKPLIIDPAILMNSGFLGGAGDEEGTSVAVDSNGNAYVTGLTTSPENTFPDTVGPDLSFNGNYDAFIAKIRPDGTLAYVGYIGGSGDEAGLGVAVDAGGNAYVTGLTTSTEATFPIKVGPDLTFNGVMDAFVCKINPTGTDLVYSGYVGGASDDEGSSIAVDANGNAYISGTTTSSEASFPVKVGPDLTFNGLLDAFVAKVKPDGTGLVYAGYVGGSSEEQGHSIAIDSSGNAYLAGLTFSSEATFPVKVGPDLTYNGGGDAFIAKVNADGAALGYAGYIGGNGFDEAFGVAVDNVGRAYTTGKTTSPETSFPVVVGPSLKFSGNVDAFVSRVKADGTGFEYSGYIGGTNVDEAYAIATNSTGNAWLVGYTQSTETSFPVKDGPDVTINGGRDTFVAKVNSTGAGLVYAGYIGGSADEEAFGVAVDSGGNAWVAGRTISTEATFPKKLGPALTSAGGADVFVAQIAEKTGNPIPTIASLNPSFAIEGDPAFDLTVNGTDFVNGAVVRWSTKDLATTFGSATKLSAIVSAAEIAKAGTANITVFNPEPGGGESSATNINILPKTAGYEADVAPRPFGNNDGTIRISDWVQIGRLAVGVDTVRNGSEFQRADCAPKSTKGNGVLSLADWVQAGRYAAGIDPLTEVGGPTAPTPSFAEAVAAESSSEAATTIRALNANFQRGLLGTLLLELDAQGQENGVGFTLNYDPNYLIFVEAKPGTDTNGATVQVNTSQAANGRVGLMLAMPSGQGLSAGKRVILGLSFIPASGTANVTTQVSFSDQITRREMVNTEAATLATPTFTGATINISGKSFATVSTASYIGQVLAAEQIASSFGTDLSLGVEAARTVPLPDKLNGTTIKVKDSKGVERAASLFYVSPTQVNFQIPTETAEGIATIKVTNAAGLETLGLVVIGKVAPAIFSADATGRGLAAASVVRVRANGSRSNEVTGKYDAATGRIVPVPIDLGEVNDQVYLELYGTGVRGRSDLSAVQAKIGGLVVPVEFVGAQPGYVGLDQVNLKLPCTLLGKGAVNIELIADDRSANAVSITIR